MSDSRVTCTRMLIKLALSVTVALLWTYCGTLISYLDNYIDGEAFISLTEQDIKGMVAPIGLVKKILKLRQVNCIPAYLNYRGGGSCL